VGKSGKSRPDSVPRVIAGATELPERAEGKPGTVAAEAAGVTLIVERNPPPKDPESSLETPPAA
jgi:hypothetical protein